MITSTQNPGALKHRVELQEKQTMADGFGGQTSAWQSRAFLWARVAVQSQREGESGDHLVAELTHQVLIRFRDSITAGMRFVYAGRVLRILSCADFDGEKRFLTCLCQEEK